MKTLINKVKKILMTMQDLNNNLFFQALPNENKKDFSAAVHAWKVFVDNLPTEKQK